MNRSTLLSGKFALALLAGSLVGCGGGGGVASGFPDPVPGDRRPSGPGIDGGATLATLTAGATWRYVVTGTITKDYFDGAGVKKTRSAAVTNGTIVRTLAQVSFNGGTALKMTETFSYTPQGGTPVVEISQKYLQQDVNGDLSVIGDRDNNLDYSTDGPLLVAPGTFAVSPDSSSNVNGYTTNQSSYAPFDAPVFTWGTKQIQSSMAVTRVQDVLCTSGPAFRTWQTLSSINETLAMRTPLVFEAGVSIVRGFVDQSSRQTTSTDNWCASIGAPVKSHVVSNKVDTVVLTFAVTAAPVFTAPQSAGTYAMTYDTLNDTRDLVLTLSSYDGV